MYGGGNAIYNGGRGNSMYVRGHDNGNRGQCNVGQGTI